MLYLYKSYLELNIVESSNNYVEDIENLSLEGVSTVAQPQKIGFSMNKSNYKVVNLGGVNLIEYKGKMYNEQQIKSNISANKSKVKKYKERKDFKKVDQYINGVNRWGKMLKALKAGL